MDKKKDPVIYVRVKPEVHTEVKMRAAKRRISMQDYVAELIEKELYGKEDEKE